MLFRLNRLLYRTLRFGWRRVRHGWDMALTRLYFYLNGVVYGPGLQSYGIPVVDINEGGKMEVGNGLVLISGMNHSNRIGRQQPCFFIVAPGGRLRIGNRVGMSGTSLVCHAAITIGNDVTIGGNTVIYDTDFHSLDPAKRAGYADNALANMSPVTLEDGVFVGAHVIILKGVTIGKNAIIGAGSVVTKSVPPGEVWAGNPARCLPVNRDIAV